MTTTPSLDEASLEDALEETQQGFLAGHEEPATFSHEVELLLEPENVDDADSSENQWPSIKPSLCC